MTIRISPPPPGFGQADLSNCEREQIHLTASIQPHGALLVVREPDHMVVQASANAADFLMLSEGVLHRPLDQIAPDLAEQIRPHLEQPLDNIPLAVRFRVGRPSLHLDGLLHRPPAGGLVIELEHAGPRMDLSAPVQEGLELILASSTLRGVCDEAARIIQNLTGYDRVMVYRFDDEGHGEVFSERRADSLEPYLGNRYPASDIPQIARRLYERNRVRVLVDVNYQAVPLEPRLSPLTGEDLDMSLCLLRSMSPIHIQYLKNMGVGATLVVSIMVGGRLWGLIACHHYAPRFVHYEMRVVCELVAEALATRLAALQSFAQAQAELSVRRLEQRMIEAISRDGDWKGALFDNPQALLKPLEASGAALLLDGEVHSTGEVPGTKEIREIGVWLQEQAPSPVFATASLGLDELSFSPVIAVASGLVATPISDIPGEYLLWFRPERVRTVTWGGNPFKPVTVGNDPSQLSPRRSFAQWHQLVEGTSEPWSEADLTAARLIGESVADVILQFRAVRLLIAQDQLAQVRAQVEGSLQATVVADAGGRILLVNEAMRSLWGRARSQPQALQDLASCLAHPAETAQFLRDLQKHWVPWRGEVLLTTDAGEERPLAVRADPVYAARDRVLGFVVLFTDLKERKAADQARRQFQDQVVEQHRAMSLPLDSQADLLYRNLLAAVVSNAQLAALEITDGVDLGRMPEMLESVRGSVSRASELLEYLLWHASHTQDHDP